jgi:hypothetical protein
MMTETPRPVKESRIRASLGPSFPVVPVTNFTKGKFPRGTMEAMWDIIGPTVQVNMDESVHLWEIFTICYMQGLANGSDIAEDKLK